MFARRPGWTGGEGPRAVLTIAPGAVSIGWPDVSRQTRTAERAVENRRAMADALAHYAPKTADEDPAWPDVEPSRVITCWSAKSRSRMVRTLAELDYGPMFALGLDLAMHTLTYPGDWLTVAPTGKAVKRHLGMWRKRFKRAWGFDFVGVWKLEFQRRGAPHIHMWGPVPAGAAGDFAQLTNVRQRPAVGDGLPYREWLSVVWADIVDHPDPEERRKHRLAGTGVDFKEGARMTDPKRLAVYFTKHGSFSAKEYQNEVPAEWQEPGQGPGRFWGYWGLTKATAGVELDPADGVFALRTLRRYARSAGRTELTRDEGGVVVEARRVRVTREVSVPRDGSGGVRIHSPYGNVIGLAGAQFLASYAPTKFRKVRRPVARMRGQAGFLCVNDGPGLAAQLARALDSSGADEQLRRAWRRAGEERIRRLELAATERTNARLRAEQDMA